MTLEVSTVLKKVIVVSERYIYIYIYFNYKFTLKYIVVSFVGGFSGAEDIFSTLFGGGPLSSFFGGGSGRRRKMRGQDMAHPLKVSLEDLYNGKKSKLQLSKRVICSTCHG